MAKTTSRSRANTSSLVRAVSESWISRHRAQSQSTDWGQSLAMYGLFRAYLVDRNPEVREYLKTWLSFHLAEEVPVNYFCGSWSFGLLYPEIEKEFPEYQMQLRETAERIYDFIVHKALRNGDGVLLHNIDLPNIYIDTVYYSSVTLAKLGTYLKKPWQELAVMQIVLHLERLQDGDKPFFIHCEENNGGKRSEGSWARGNGWVMMALAEIIPMLPKSARRNDLIAIFKGLSAALADVMTKSGSWRTILDDKSAYEEVSAAAMYTFAYRRAVRLGILDSSFEIIIERAEKALVAAVDRGGVVTGVSEGTWPGTIEYYKSLGRGEWWWGTGAWLLAMTEGR